MNYAGNPYGTYIQDEACVHCGSAIGQANQRNLPQRLATRAAHWLNSAQAAVSRPQANWMHMRMDRPA